MYKRQLYLLAPVPGKRPVVPVCACVVTLCLSALLTAKTVQRQDLALTVLDVGQGQSVAVSYTHLDVYKRQEQGGSFLFYFSETSEVCLCISTTV